MKQLSLLCIALLLVGVLSVQASRAEDYTCGNVPDGALVQKGKGRIGGDDRAVVYSPDGTRLVMAMAMSNSVSIRLCDAYTGTEVALLTGHTGPVVSVFFLPDGTTLASVSEEDGTIWLWDTTNGRDLAVLQGYTESIVSVFLSPDGTTSVSVSEDGTIRLWDTANGREFALLRGYTESIVSVFFSPAGTTLASVGEDGAIRVWDVDDARELAVLRGPRESIVSVSFSPAGTTLASVGEDGRVVLWDAAEWTAEEKLKDSGTMNDGDMDDGDMGDSDMGDSDMNDGDMDDGETMGFAFAGEVESKAYTAGTAITPLVLPEATGGEGEVTYRVSDLPAGLAFDETTRTISGTPEAATDGAVEVTYTAQDSAGTAATLTFSITVNPELSFGDLFDLFN